jgi:hypothetical protein
MKVGECARGSAFVARCVPLFVAIVADSCDTFGAG